jgi:hypothetical protein
LRSTKPGQRRGVETFMGIADTEEQCLDGFPIDAYLERKTTRSVGVDRDQVLGNLERHGVVSSRMSASICTHPTDISNK